MYPSEMIKDIIMKATRHPSFPTMKSQDIWKSARHNPILNPLTLEIIEAAAQQQGTSIPSLTYRLFRLFRETGDREQYQEVYFAKRGRLSMLALAFMMTDNDDYLSSLEDILWDICGEYTWSLPAHLPADDSHTAPYIVDLMAAETAQALAEILIIVGDRLSATLSLRIRAEVERRVFEPAFERDIPFEWKTATHNWSAVCAGATGIAALLLIEDANRLAEIMSRVSAALDHFLAGYGDDGGCAEGLGYWVYGFGYYVYFADSLREYTNGKLDLMLNPKARAISSFPANIHLSAGVSANFSDSAEVEILPSGLLSHLANKMNTLSPLPLRIPSLHDDPCYRWCHISRNILWSDPSAFVMHSQPKNTYLNNLEWLVCRGNIHNATGVAVPISFSAKGGHNDEPHNHNDLGHFIIHAGGENLLCDLGAGMYTKAYFSEGREKILNISSTGHSVPLIRGVMQHSAKEASAIVREISLAEDRASYTLELSSAYAMLELKQFTRSFNWECTDGSNQAHLKLEDVFEFQEGTEVTMKVEERFMSKVMPNVHPDIILWKGHKAELSLLYDRNLLEVIISPIQHQDHDGKPFTLYQTSLTCKGEPLENSHETWHFEFTLATVG